MNEDDNPTPFKRAKRRLQNACDECRKRKAQKCPIIIAPIAWDLEFRARIALPWKRRPPNSLADAQQLVNSILSTSKPFIVPRDTQTVHQLLVDLAHYARSLERRASPSASSSPEHTSDPADPFCLGHEPPTPAGFYIHTEMSPAEEVDLNNIKDIFGLLTLEETAPRHFGPSSTVKFIHSVLFLKQRIKGTKERVSRKRPQFWSIYPWQAERVEPPPEYIFPSNALMHELVDIFFEKINAYLPLLHRPTFEKCIADDLHRQNSQFGATVLAVCACAARYSNNPQVLADPTEELSAGWHYFRQVRLLRPSFVSLATVYELQLYCLACIFLYSTTTPEACWTLLGHAVRCAQDMGIHRSPPKHAKPTVESQLLNRAFWCLFVIDVVMTGAVGRPRAIHPDEYDVPLPIDCDDEYWETANPEDAFKQPPGKPSSISFWISFIKLFDILAFSQLKMCIVRKSDTDSEWTERNVMEIDSRLNAWVDTIPEHHGPPVKWDPNRVNNLFFHQSAILNMTYYWVQMQVHRPFIILIQKEIVSPLPSQAICANAARSCCHIMAAQHRRDVISHPVTLVGMPCPNV
ncbi:Gypsy retrotransposon integrase-like protein 1 [Paramarasmius palmivorus]|uniref:Gypsy retrotransposon integrase-like protein 1 n=1 Tax=Paramarasmius palmivorus TaxID=297713 RepID=A0AAW0EDY1_9AGAR